MKKLLPFSKYLILAILIYTPIFCSIEDLSIRQYDESRLAQSAIEMSRSNNFIVVTFNNLPEMWSTKPPLMIWCQALCVKLFGVRELSIRLPSALAALFTCCLLVFVCHKYLKKPWLGFIAVLVLITTNGYVDEHATRTGDYDALLTLFLMGYCLLFFIYSETKSNKHLYLFFISLTLAVLTKGVAGLMFLPAVFLFSVIYKQTMPLLKNKHFYFGLGIFLFFVLGYYFLREAKNPGYLNAVSQNELGGRFNEVNEGHTGDEWYYYNIIIKYFFTNWYLLIPCGVLIGLFHKDKVFVKFSTLILISFLSFLIIISVAKTKLEWYAIPLYPLASLLAAIFIYFIFNFLTENNLTKKALKLNTLPVIFLFLIFVNPYSKIISKTYMPEEYSWNKDRYEVAYFFKDAIIGCYNLQNYFYLNEAYVAQDYFYLERLKQKGVNINRKNFWELAPGDHVIVAEASIKDYIAKNYEANVEFTKNHIVLYKIIGRNVTDGVAARVKALKAELQSNKKWLNELIEKSKKRNIPLDSCINQDIRWLIEQETQKK
jgi:4-amino-4-deoxy-L-arabinose transferase-like glycosyltransferase